MFMKGVILAAGDGNRLAPLTLNCPKALVRVNNRPMIDYTIEAFVRAGITDLIIVVGYLEEMIRAWVGEGKTYGASVEYVSNPNFKTGNAISLYSSHPFVSQEPFILSMVDHMIRPEIVTALLEQESSHSAICVDYQLHNVPNLDDATKVWVNEDGFVTNIGKWIHQWNAIDTGVFLFTPAIFTAISSLTRTARGAYQISEAVTWFLQAGHKVRSCDISGTFWFDVDTLEDLCYAESILGRASEQPL